MRRRSWWRKRTIPSRLIRLWRTFPMRSMTAKIYYRENSRMKPVELSVTAQNRVKGMIAIRDCTRELIAYQTEGDPDEEIEGQQKKLNHLYDLFQRKYGLLNSRANSMAFSDDSSYPSSLFP